MLETEYVGDNIEMLVTVLDDFVTNILYESLSPHSLSKIHLSSDLCSLNSLRLNRNIGIIEKNWPDLAITLFIS